MVGGGHDGSILRAVHGENLLTRPRWPGPYKMIQLMFRSSKATSEPEREFELRFERWLSQRKNK